MVSAIFLGINKNPITAMDKFCDFYRVILSAPGNDTLMLLNSVSKV